MNTTKSRYLKLQDRYNRLSQARTRRWKVSHGDTTLMTECLSYGMYRIYQLVAGVWPAESIPTEER